MAAFPEGWHCLWRLINSVHIFYQKEQMCTLSLNTETKSLIFHFVHFLKGCETFTNCKQVSDIFYTIINSGNLFWQAVDHFMSELIMTLAIKG